MGSLKKQNLEIEGIYLIQNAIYEDERGSFSEIYNKKDFLDIGLDLNFVQENLSVSKKGVLRGLHYQKHFPQGKLIKVLKGKIFDIAVDIRKDSETYLKWISITIDSKDNKQLYIPPGFAHGFLTLSDEALVCYRCTDYYHPEDECGIRWNDPTLNINWPVSYDNKQFFVEDDIPLCLNVKDESWPLIT